MKTVFIIAAGSGLGGVARYGLQTLVYRVHPGKFPAGTLLVNLLGCFLIGLFIALAEKAGAISQEVKLLLVTGFCGGFTTFSTFSVESIALLKAGSTFYFMLYAAGSVTAGMLMTWLGMHIIKAA